MMMRLPGLPGRFEIDWRNPLTQGLIVCVHQGVDLVSGQPAVPVSAYGAALSGQRAGRYGMGIASRGTPNGGFVVKNVAGISQLFGKSASTLAAVATVGTMNNFGVLVGVPHNDSTWSTPFVMAALTRNNTNNNGRAAVAKTTSGTVTGLAGNNSFFNATVDPQVYGMIDRGNNVPFIICRNQETVEGGVTGAGTYYHQSNSFYIFSRNLTASGEGSQGVCWLACMWDHALTVGEWKAFAANPMQLVMPYGITSYFFTAGDPATLLTVQNVALSVAADSVALSQANTLSVADALLSSSVDGFDLIVSGELSVEGIAISSAVDAVELTQVNTLQVEDSVTSIAADAVVLSQAGALTVADVALAASIGSPALVQANLLAVADVSVSVAARNIVLTQANILSVADATLSSLMDSVVLSTADFLVVARMDLSVSLGSAGLLQANVLSVADMLVGSAMDSVVLALNSFLSVADLSVAVAVDSVAISQASLLSVQSMDLAVLSDSPVLIQENALAVNDVRLSILMDSLTIGGGVFVTESALGFVVRDFQYVLLVEA